MVETVLPELPPAEQLVETLMLHGSMSKIPLVRLNLPQYCRRRDRRYQTAPERGQTPLSRCDGDTERTAARNRLRGAQYRGGQKVPVALLGAKLRTG